MRQKIREKQSGGLHAQNSQEKNEEEQPPTPDKAPTTASDMVDNTMMDILVDMSSRMQVMGNMWPSNTPSLTREIRALF